MIWSPSCQILIIFTHLKLWIASARHNFKWVKIQIELFGGERVKVKARDIVLLSHLGNRRQRPNIVSTTLASIKPVCLVSNKHGEWLNVTTTDSIVLRLDNIAQCLLGVVLIFMRRTWNWNKPTIIQWRISTYYHTSELIPNGENIMPERDLM